MPSSSSPKTSASPSSTTNYLNQQKRSAILPLINRSAGRNVHIYDADNTNTVLSGLVLAPSVTNSNFYTMAEILSIFSSPFYLRVQNRERIEKDDQPLLPGNTSSFLKLPSKSMTNHGSSEQSAVLLDPVAATFTEAVRSRDRRCVISGANVYTFDGVDFWEGLEAAHIFPLAYEGYWINHDYGRWITDQPTIGGSINSAQNGLLLDSTIHQLFDTYNISINPDDNYKVVVFRPNSRVIGGQHLDSTYFVRPDTPAYPPLRWHFRQAVMPI